MGLAAVNRPYFYYFYQAGGHYAALIPRQPGGKLTGVLKIRCEVWNEENG